MKRDPLEQFRNTLSEALYHAEMNSDLIRVRHLLRRALNITDERLREKHREQARETGIGNISDTAAKLRPVLELHGLTIVAERPDTPIRNRWGDESQQHVWRIAVLRG